MNEWGETVMTLSVLGSVMGEKILLFMEKKENLYFHLLHINFVFISSPVYTTACKLQVYLGGFKPLGYLIGDFRFKDPPDALVVLIEKFT